MSLGEHRMEPIASSSSLQQLLRCDGYAQRPPKIPDAESCTVILMDNASLDRRGKTQCRPDWDPRVIRIHQALEIRGYSCGNNPGIDQAGLLGIDRVVTFKLGMHSVKKDSLLQNVDPFVEENFLPYNVATISVLPFLSGIGFEAVLFSTSSSTVDRLKEYLINEFLMIIKSFQQVEYLNTHFCLT